MSTSVELNACKHSQALPPSGSAVLPFPVKTGAALSTKLQLAIQTKIQHTITGRGNSPSPRHRSRCALRHQNHHTQGARPTRRPRLWSHIYRHAPILSPLDPPNTRHKESKNLSPPDHMLSIEWTASQGWLPPRITPYQNLSLDPATCVFHYALECFEGMKAYKTNQGQLRLFRPDKNMARLNKSAARIALPTVDGDAFTRLISTFVAMEERFIPA